MIYNGCNLKDCDSKALNGLIHRSWSSTNVLSCIHFETIVSNNSWPLNSILLLLWLFLINYDSSNQLFNIFLFPIILLASQKGKNAKLGSSLYFLALFCLLSFPIILQLILHGGCVTKGQCVTVAAKQFFHTG